MKHLCILIVYDNINEIKLCFESIYQDNIDFFIIENKSENTEKIKEYFLQKNLKGYILFEKNIAANAVNIFIRDFYELMHEYDYITLTDGDFYVYDSKSLFNELILNLNNKNVVISSADLYLQNNYNRNDRIVGIDYYIDMMKNRKVENGYNVKHTANNFVTLKKENLFLLKNLYYLDTNLINKVKEIEKIWVATKNNLVYHLTWDLYFDGNPYYEFKKKHIDKIWKIMEDSTYQKII
jgi:hypothetical protein